MTTPRRDVHVRCTLATEPRPVNASAALRMKNVYRFSFLAGAALALAACSPTIDNRGALLKPEQLEKVHAGQSEDDVMAILGTPSSTMNYGEDVWLYISSKVKQEAFFKPEETERTVVSVYFDKDGKVREVKKTGLKDGQDVDMVSRETPTAGKDMSILEQLLGNVGRFTKQTKGP